MHLRIPLASGNTAPRASRSRGFFLLGLTLFGIQIIFPPPIVRANTIAFITNQQADTVSVIDTKSRSVIGHIAVGQEPAGITTSLKFKRAWISTPGDHSISEIHCNTLQPGTAITAGEGPLAITIDEQRELLYVADWYQHTVMAITVCWYQSATYRSSRCSSTVIASGPSPAVIAVPDCRVLQCISEIEWSPGVLIHARLNFKEVVMPAGS